MRNTKILIILQRNKKMKKKSIKKYVIVTLMYTLVFASVYFYLTGSKYIYGSQTDFASQHYFIPEYFRTLFYKTHDLLPDFALNLGGGANIYYLSYYGFLSPIILISYFLPSISMLNYIILSTSAICIFSSVLMYKYLKKNNIKESVSFVGGLMLLCSSSMMFHSHRHIMFINYMPFLILGLFGVDKYFKEKNGILLIISSFLMIMTSYYYSVGGLVVLFFFGVYRYLQKEKFELKTFVKDMLKFMIPFIISIMLACLLLLPTAYCLLNGRTKGTSSINLINLIFPSLSFNNIIYSAYSPGVTAICVLSIIYLIKKGKRPEKFLGIMLFLISVFPLFNYILNGTLYIDAKSLIPFLPVLIYSNSLFIDKFIKNKIEFKNLAKIIIGLIIFGLINLSLIKLKVTNAAFNSSLFYIIDLFLLLIVFYISKKTKNKKFILVYFSIFVILVSFKISSSDKFISKENDFLENADIIENIIKEDDNFYRINNHVLQGSGQNKITNIDHLSSTIYSSAFNRNYNKFYYDVFNNAVTFRNRSMTANSTNVLFNNYFGEKYIITNEDVNLGYSYSEKGKFRIYKNEDTYPIGYATNKIYEKTDYEKLTYPNNIIALMSGAIVNNNSNFIPESVTKTILDFEVIDEKNITYKKTDNGYKVKTDKTGQLKIKINNPLKDKVLFLRFKNNNDPVCPKADLSITINGTKNKLTCSTWKYHNQNFTFDYVIYNQNILDITFTKGEYDLSDFETYVFDYDIIKNIPKELDAFIINKEKSYGDFMFGTINPQNDGYFIIQIPYDKGFKITLDNKNIKYENVNSGLIGFPISKGQHDIKIEFIAPYKKLGITISSVGLILFITYIIIVKRKKVKSLYKLSK